jgi:hypothetical protein
MNTTITNILSFSTQDRAEPLNDKDKERLANYRKGQLDRAKGSGCLSSNGSYLDGWYSPEQELPPFLSGEERNGLTIV